MAETKKTRVVEILFDRFWPNGTARPTGPMVATNADVMSAIRQRNEEVPGGKKLSDANPANFLKDFIRKTTCNKNWPERLKLLHITARQRYGNGQVFEFVDFRDGDAVPFPDRYEPDEDMPAFVVESLSIPRQARALGRSDEAWLTQVVVGQRIAHTHFAVFSKQNAVELTHLQMSVKTQPEIDAVFVATIEAEGKDIPVLITCEAKQINERLLEDQIREQVAQAFLLTKELKGTESISAVIPCAVRVVDRKHTGGNRTRGIYFVEFELIERTVFETKFKMDNLHQMPLTLVSRAFYELKPKVKGISS